MFDDGIGLVVSIFVVIGFISVVGAVGWGIYNIIQAFI
jgi:hypothetical protein